MIGYDTKDEDKNQVLCLGFLIIITFKSIA